MKQLDKNINKYYFDLLTKNKKVFYSIKDDKVYLSDSYMINIINKDNLLLNLEQFNYVDLTKFIEELDFSKYDIYTDWYLKDNLACLINDNINVKLDKKYFKLYYGNFFYITGDIKPIIVKSEDEIIGIILPMKVY